ncbi:sensor histidine kinase [Cupriavidus plantarum]|uniref:Virulence sensor protein BvgS n=2 Tax=Cupriavidus plantarum TaxID=942865 RepID=A0A316F1T1_9BURK|nr:ATP-binding protein [Cupriavidus plantarum]NYH98851.1 signal transduction histidine kinase [Cupriavidus plantarum]PWK37479.1 signal transduction histidine kinase [Cupriavidus plantarum]REF01776.1 signal transduction histidine kinase [Cupriavidus plantarum]RLK45363.1 signal transduction histidine kinase [Cupriavidus plantarum]CAG2128284.1 Sensor histidine kinase RcsC [Cupriavidus plantarum]
MPELEHDPATLQAMLAARTQEVEALRAELEETNRGVLALYSELDIQADQLRQATELKSRFLAYMSHEFRTPIVAIQSITRLLIDRVDGPLTTEQERQVKFVRDTASEFAEMVNDLLDLARLEAGRVDVSPAWFDMVALFDALRGMFKPVLTNPEVSLIFEEPNDIPKLFADDRKLSQILRNFISNALKFTPSGEVRIAVHSDDPATITFSVRDTGIGIPAEAHGAVFQDFVQIDSPLQRRYRGSGLGLALSKRLAEVLGGQVGFESEVGVGSRFYVTLPVTYAAPAGDAANLTVDGGGHGH